MAFYTNIIWSDENINSKEYIEYIEILKSIGNFRFICLKEIKESFVEVKKIKFEETIIIVSGKLYIDFIEELKENLTSIYIIPKIIIFTKNKYDFYEHNEEYNNIINHPFYNFDGVKTNFNELKIFLSNQKNITQTKKDEEEGQFTFEYIDCKKKLILPTLFKALIEVEEYNLNKFNEFLYNKYYKSSKSLDDLLNIIKSIPDIPLELLSKFYTRIYTLESNFYRDLNKDLRDNKRDNYLPYIQVLYEGTKLKSLSLASNNLLYRGTILSNKEILTIKANLNKIPGLPGAIIFTKAFLSFSKDKNIAENFIKNKTIIGQSHKVLFTLEKDNNIDYSLSTHADIESISYFPSEKEVLFFPFSSFEIKDINEVIVNSEIRYEIKLLYLGKYLKDLENDKELNQKEIDIPDSHFKNQITKLGLIKPDNFTTKNILEKFKKYKNDIEDLNKNKKIKKKNNVDILKKQNSQINIIFQSEDFIHLEKNKFLSKFKNDNNLYNLLKNLKEIQDDLCVGPTGLSKRMFDFRGNRFEGWSIGEKRGGFEYDPPLGWIGFGLKVPDDVDNSWLGMNHISSWSIAYHGVGNGLSSDEIKDIIGKICRSGFKSGTYQPHVECEDKYHSGKEVGKGVLFFQKIRNAEKNTGTIKINGLNYKVVLMVRIKPSSIRTCR